MISIMTGFTPEVGSSSRMMRGRPISTVANSSSLRWPNESVPAGASASRVRPKSSSTSRARLRSDDRTRERSSEPHGCRMAAAMFSITVRFEKTRGCWKVRHSPIR